MPVLGGCVEQRPGEAEMLINSYCLVTLTIVYNPWLHVDSPPPPIIQGGYYYNLILRA